MCRGTSPLSAPAARIKVIPTIVQLKTSAQTLPTSANPSVPFVQPFLFAPRSALWMSYCLDLWFST